VPWLYTIYGLRLLCNRPIPGLGAYSNTLPSEVHICLEEMPPWLNERTQKRSREWYTTSAQDECGRPLLTVWELEGGVSFRFCYGDGTEFVIDRLGTHVWATWPATATLAATLTYLLRPVLGFVLRQRSVPCLHASAVAVGDHAIAPAGALPL
jgi:hypothetical protein